MTNTIQYRGETLSLEEFLGARAKIEQNHLVRHITYRGAEADVDLHRHQPRPVAVNYRGASDTVDL